MKIHGELLPPPPKGYVTWVSVPDAARGPYYEWVGRMAEARLTERSRRWRCARRAALRVLWRMGFLLSMLALIWLSFWLFHTKQDETGDALARGVWAFLYCVPGILGFSGLVTAPLWDAIPEE